MIGNGYTFWMSECCNTHVETGTDNKIICSECKQPTEYYEADASDFE